jgi:hypothetical protein
MRTARDFDPPIGKNKISDELVHFNRPAYDRVRPEDNQAGNNVHAVRHQIAIPGEPHGGMCFIGIESEEIAQIIVAEKGEVTHAFSVITRAGQNPGRDKHVRPCQERAKGIAARAELHNSADIGRLAQGKPNVIIALPSVKNDSYLFQIVPAGGSHGMISGMLTRWHQQQERQDGKTNNNQHHLNQRQTTDSIQSAYRV